MIISLLAAIAVVLAAGVSKAADLLLGDSINMIDPTPVSEQKPAVDGLNFKVGVVSGVLGGYSNHMLVTSVSMPMPYLSSFGIQLDLAAGNYRSDFTSAASGLHIFYRDPGKGLLGIYGDYGYVDSEHGGRVGIEASTYQGRWSVDVLAGVQFGQHFLTRFIDEVDLSYYFTDNFKGSVGHRLISRGHVANVGFEYAPSNNGWSIYGEAETGEDDYHGAWAGVRYSFGSSAGKSLIERDRESDPLVRIPRNIASLTQCADGDPHPSWNGFETSYTTNLCGSKADISDYNGDIGKIGIPAPTPF